MPDHTEREREARVRLEATMDRSNTTPIDAYRAAVRSAVLAEVRAKVEGMDDFGFTPVERMTIGEIDVLDRHMLLATLDVLAALTALEATNGR